MLTPRDRFLAALRRERVYPLPVGAVTQPATCTLMEAAAAPWPDAHLDARRMAGLAAAAHGVFGFDCVRVPFDQTIEAELLGCQVDHGTRTSNCSVRSQAWSLDDPPPALPDLGTGRAKVVTDALALLARDASCDAAVVGGLVGPFTLVCQVAGLSAVLMDALRRPDALRPWLDFAVRFATDYAKRQVEAGAHVICLEDMSASLELTSPGIYRTLILPAQRELIAGIKVPVILHVCGNNTRIIDLLHQTGTAALSLEDRTDLARAVDGPCALIGGIAPAGVLLNGTVEDVTAVSEACIAAGVHVLAPGCGIVPDTPAENVRRMVAVARGSAKQEGRC